jgi:hypothetical protein
MGEVVRLSSRRVEQVANMQEVVVFLSCDGGEVGFRAPAVEDTPENRAQIGRMLLRAAESLGERGSY